MKKIIKNLLIILIFLFAFLIIGNVKSMASGDLFLNQLNFDAKINYDGSMDVVETWDIDVEETNTLYKTFKTDSTKYSGITNVQVSDITNGTQKSFKEINTLMYHVTKDCYYGMKNDDGDFEIAWGVGLDNSSATKKYQISYTVEDTVEKYSDYAQLYWQFVGKDFNISSNQITGTITLPTDAKDKDEIKVWGHTEDLNGEIYARGQNKIKFEVNNFRAGRYVELRTLFPTDMIISSARGDESKTILDEVVEEETIWANEANSRRAMKNFMNWAIVITIDIALIFLCLLFIKNMIKNMKRLKNLKKFIPTEDILYFREMPRENSTPAEAIYMYKKIKSELQSNDLGKVFSATLLDLKLKKIIDFQVIKDQKAKEVITIKILDKAASGNLENKDEKAILDFLLGAFTVNNKEEITVKELQAYIKNHSSKILALQSDIKEGTKAGLRKNNLMDKAEEEKYQKVTGALIGYIVALVFTITGGFILLGILEKIYILIGVIPFILLSIINLILKSVELSRINVFTQEGVNESEKWKGLKKYMEEFSMLDRREVPEIEIWEKFLVYATAFGIADKVLKQLKIVYPDIENSMNINTYPSMYLMMNTDFSRSFTDSISSSMSSAYSSASGGGGGFSGGGGGGRRPEVVEVVDRYHL